jgi:hypothetical protein
MEKTLRELERAFCAGSISRRDFFRRTALIVGGTAAAFELLGRLSPRRLAWASPGITLDPTVDPLAQGYETDGTAEYASGSRLVINDTGNLHRTFYKTEPEITAGDVTVDVTVEVSSGSLTLNGIDTGVRAILSEGAGGFEIGAALIERAGGDRRVALLTGGGMTQGIPLEWSIEKTFRLQRNADPAQRAVLTVSGFPPEVLTDLDLPPARRANPNFEFGCSSDPATAIAFWGPIGQTSFPMTITANRCDLFPNASEKVHIEGSFALAMNSNGIDPSTQPVALRLFNPADGTRIYPVGTDKMPIAMVPITGGWKISDAEKTRTGIQDFQILQTGDPSYFVFKLVDTRCSISL